MKPEKLKSIALVVLPLAAALLAGLPDAVRVLYFQTEQIGFCSYFALVEEAAAGLCLPFAGYCAALTFGMAVLFLVTRKAWCRWAVMIMAFLSMTLAVIPVLVQGDVRLMPGMLPPVLMGVELLVCRVTGTEAPKTRAQRLQSR